MTDRENVTASATESAVPSAEDPIRELAAMLIAEKVTRKPVEVVARILAAHDSGDPPNRSAKSVDVHHSAVSRVIDAAAAHRQRTLAGYRRSQRDRRANRPKPIVHGLSTRALKVPVELGARYSGWPTVT